MIFCLWQGLRTSNGKHPVNYHVLRFADAQYRANLTPQQYRSLLSISKQNIKIWPHPLSVKLAIQKSVIHTALAGVVREAGGFAEKIYKIDSVTSGLQYLASGYVIKRDCSYEGRHVYLPPCEPYISACDPTQPLASEKNFKKHWNLNPSGFTFFALKSNPALFSLGEVRTFITYGRVVEVLHTLPEDYRLKRTRMLHESCYGYLADITKIKRPEQE